MDQIAEEMYRNIIHVMNHLDKLPKKQRNDLDVRGIHKIINYVLKEYIRFKGINNKKEITDQMIRDINTIYSYDEIENDNSNLSKLSKKDISVVADYIVNTSDHDSDVLDELNALQKLDKMRGNCLID